MSSDPLGTSYLSAALERGSEVTIPDRRSSQPERQPQMGTSAVHSEFHQTLRALLRHGPDSRT